MLYFSFWLPIIQFITESSSHQMTLSSNESDYRLVINKHTLGKKKRKTF
jgi:hypothetical protein